MITEKFEKQGNLENYTLDSLILFSYVSSLENKFYLRSLYILTCDYINFDLLKHNKKLNKAYLVNLILIDQD